MTKARAVFALWGTTAVAGTALALAALLVALTRIDLAVPSLGELAAACRRWLLPHADPASIVVLAIGGLGAAAIIASLRAAVRQLRTTRRFQRRLPVIGRVPGAPEVAVVDSASPEAFCAGLLRPRVYVSTAALTALSEHELAAVLAHERHHARRRDPLRLLVARIVGEGLFFLPVIRRLAARYAALAELDADDAARRTTGGPKALASALLVFDSHSSPAAVGISPQRVDCLLGARVRWELPVLLLAGAAVTLVFLAALAIRLAQATDHAALPLPVVLAQACMLAMALIPIAAGATGLLAARRLRQRTVGAGARADNG